MRSIWILLFSLVTALIVMSFSFFKPSYSDIASNIIAKVGKNLAKKHKMDFVGTSGGMIDCVRMVGFSFQINRPVSRDEARYLIVDCVEELLKAFNENEKIRPFLMNYPFTEENVDIAIYIAHPQWSGAHEPNAGIVDIYTDKYIVFKIRDKPAGKLLETSKELYQEALARVKKDSQSSKMGTGLQN